MRIHGASRRVRWAVPTGVLLAIAIAVPSGIAAADGWGNGNGGNGGNPGVAVNIGQSTTPPYLHAIATIHYPAPFATVASDDISFVDATTHTYYLSDRTNEGIDAVNTLTNTFGGVIGAGDFVGASPSTSAAQKTICGTSVKGPNGVLSLTIDGVNQLWAGNGVTATTTSSVKVFTLTSGTSGTLAATISTADAAFGTTGTCRADEMAYDATDHIFIVANDADSPPYVTLISVNANPSLDKIVGQIKFPNATGGIEQTVWDPANDSFYTNIPGVELAKIDPTTDSVVATYAVPNCNNTGLALDPFNQTMLSACGVNPFGSALISARTGAVIARFPQVSGSDENWYDPGTNAFYLGASGMTADGTSTGLPTPVIGVIGAGGGFGGRPGFGDQSDQSAGLGGQSASWLSNFAMGATTGDTHSVAADPSNGEVFVPVAGTGILVLKDTSSPTGL